MPSPPRVAHDALIGVVLCERYRVLDRIGNGGMSSVYCAMDLALGRLVALKLFDAGTEAIGDEQRRLSETALLAGLTHPALVTLHDAAYDRATGRELLVMELVDGPDLRDRLRRSPLDAGEAKLLLQELAEALHAIHSRGIVHRDVKPGNVLLAASSVPTRPWHPKLADFGIARLIDDRRRTASGLVIGTPGYLSPEQLNGEPVGTASDVYSLGLLVLEARTGAPAFPGRAVESANARLVRDPELPESLGADWRGLLAAMTARDPADRPTALDVALRAAELDGGLGVPADQGAASAARAAPPTAPTTLLPRPVAPESGSRRAARNAAVATGSAGDDVATGNESPRRTWIPRRLRVAAAVLALASVTVVVVVLASQPGTTAADAQTPSPLPSVPGQLGEHLEQLDEAVTR